MNDFVAVPLGTDSDDPTSDGRSVALFQSAESDLVASYTGRADIGTVADTAAGRLEAIADAAEEVYRSLRSKLHPDVVEMEIAVGLSGEVGWFVAKSSATGSLKLTLTWDGGSGSP